MYLSVYLLMNVSHDGDPYQQSAVTERMTLLALNYFGDCSQASQAGSDDYLETPGATVSLPGTPDTYT